MTHCCSSNAYYSNKSHNTVGNRDSYSDASLSFPGQFCLHLTLVYITKKRPLTDWTNVNNEILTDVLPLLTSQLNQIFKSPKIVKSFV